MASEYIKWQLEQEEKEKGPEKEPEKKPMTDKEKAANWFYYNKVFLLLGLLILSVVVYMVHVMLHPAPDPDYQIAWAGSRSLPDETADALEGALEEIGTDVNGDGQILVRINQYVVESWAEREEGEEGPGVSSPYSDMAGAATLMADLQETESYIFLMEDPEGLQERFAFLSYLDGSAPPEGASAEGCCLAWKDCPYLTSLPLGTYDLLTEDGHEDASSQDLLSNFFLARRVIGREDPSGELLANDALWEIITEGAPK